MMGLRVCVCASLKMREEGEMESGEEGEGE